MSNPMKLLVPAVIGLLTLFAILIFGAAYDTVSKAEAARLYQ